MRVCILLIAALGAPVAKANSIDATRYIINFTGSGPLPTAASFTYDPDTHTFSSFLVTWEGINFDLTSPASAPILTATVPPCLGTLTGAAASFALLRGDCAQPAGDFVTLWTARIQPTPIFGFTTYDSNHPSDSFIRVIQFANPQFGAGFIGGGGWSLTQTADPAPEPSSASLIAPALLLVALLARKRRRRWQLSGSG
jgi:MYXO-CTERM domain-containing protein